MKIYNDFKIETLNPSLQKILDKYRKERSFDVDFVIDEKVRKVNKYFGECGLNTAIVPMSGGIDSALVFGLLMKALKADNSSLKQVIPVFVPAYTSAGVTGQTDAYTRANELCEKYGVELKVVDISNEANVLCQSVEKMVGVKSDDWSLGQLIPYLRATTLYYIATLHTQNGDKSVIVGTTNADEGQYIGFYGKAADAAVDLQLLTDLHKSEVYAMSAILGVTDAIMKAVPTGDMFDARVDEDVFGAPYGFIELYRYYLSLTDEGRNALHEVLKQDNEYELFLKLQENIENMHRYNGHKYRVGSPAVHFDVMDIKIKNGWNYSIYEG